MISQKVVPSQQRLNTSIDVELTDVLDQHSRSLALNLNAHHLGTIQAFDASKQTAKVTINYPMTFWQLNPKTQTYDPMPREYPLLQDCPVMFLGGGNSNLTFPVRKGDECIVLFNDRDMDNWFKGGAGSQLNTSRIHSLSDGLVIVGIRSLPKVLGSFSTTHAALNASTGTVGVNISNGKIQIKNGNTLGPILSGFASAVETFATACEASGDTTLSVAATTLAAALVNTATQIGAILE